MRNHAVGIVKDFLVDGIVNNHLDSPNEYVPLKLVEKVLACADESTHGTFKLIFDFPEKKWKMPIIPGDAVLLRLIFAGKIITRFYTPIFCENDGKLTLLVKMYPDGKFTGILNQLPLGSEVLMRGPLNMTPAAWNQSIVDGRWRRLGLIGAGSGIAPMLLFLDYYSKNMKKDKDGNADCEIHLIVVVSKSKGEVSFPWTHFRFDC